jgi:hypothetical protein
MKTVLIINLGGDIANGGRNYTQTDFLRLYNQVNDFINEIK